MSSPQANKVARFSRKSDNGLVVLWLRPFVVTERDSFIVKLQFRLGFLVKDKYNKYLRSQKVTPERA